MVPVRSCLLLNVYLFLENVGRMVKSGGFHDSSPEISDDRREEIVAAANEIGSRVPKVDGHHFLVEDAIRSHHFD